MKEKVILCVIFWIVSLSEAQVARCDYGYQNYWTTGYKTTNDSFYSCDLSTSQANYDEKLIRIDGQEHESGHTDADVKLIIINEDHKLKTLTSIFCKKYPNLEIIQINNADLESIDEDSLINCQNLNMLMLNENKLRELPEYLLIRSSKLTFFRARSNQLTTLPKNFFLNQKDLEDLNLYGNQINFLPKNIFRSLVKLELLYLNNNKLESINPEWFVNLQNLKWLSLDGNQISEVPSNSFASLRNLEGLWLYNNKIKTLNSNCFDNLENLLTLSLYINEISDLPVGIFSQLKSLVKLYLDNNKLTSIHSDSFGVHNKLTIIDLNDNKINAIDPKFIDKTAVSTLNMTNNICSQFYTENKNEIKPKLKKCFDNYQPRGHPHKPFAQFPHQLTTSNLNVCGKSSAGQGNIIGGSYISRGNYPWIAALVTPDGQFFCGGTLISNRKVLTAAHCIQNKHTSKSIAASEFIALLGVYDLNKTFEVGRVPYAVETVNIHSDWNTFTESFDADIAVLVLDSDVMFSKYIQPICMPSLPNFVDIKTGFVVGFGKSEDTTKLHENIPKILETPIHTNENCFLQDHTLIKLSSRRTFCGGTGTGVGVCRGDSGSGLIVTDGSAYYIRGIVSSSLIGGPYGCDLNAYSIFTDVTKYVDWIDGVSTSRFKRSLI